jgi:hypothetical protein
MLDRVYPEGQTYSGPAETCSAELKGPPEQIAPGTLVDDVVATIASWFPPEGTDKLLRIKVWADWSPTFYTLYKVEVSGHASPVPWAAIIAALALIGLIILIWQVSQVDWKPVAETAKWGVIALIVLAAIVLLGPGKKPASEAGEWAAAKIRKHKEKEAEEEVEVTA